MFRTRWARVSALPFRTRAAGPYKPLSEIISPTPVEGPILLRIPTGWMVYYDYFLEEKFGASFSPDGREWSKVLYSHSIPGRGKTWLHRFR